MRPDDTVWLANGGPGIIVGINHHIISILWPTGTVTRHLATSIVHVEPFTNKELP